MVKPAAFNEWSQLQSLETQYFKGRLMAGVAGLEPVTSAVTGQRSNQLSYTPAKGDGRIKNLGEIVKVWF